LAAQLLILSLQVSHLFRAIQQIQEDQTKEGEDNVSTCVRGLKV
jgi:hypothetical protein